MMKIKALLISGFLAVTGCSSPEAVNQMSDGTIVSRISELTLSEMKLPSAKRVEINESTQVLENGFINSPVAAFELPADRGKLEIDVTSEIADSVFSPLVVIMDKEGNVLERYNSSVFEYRKPRLALGDRLVAELEFYPPVGHRYVDMIIYTNEAELAKETMAMHPGRAMAEAKGNYMPELKDMPKPHVKTGIIQVEIDGYGYMLGAKKESEYGSPAVVKTKRVKPQSETTQYYDTAIKKAVTENNIPKALGLLDEAKALGIEGAQQVFVDAVNSIRKVK